MDRKQINQIIAEILQDNLGNRITAALGNGIISEVNRAIDQIPVPVPPPESAHGPENVNLPAGSSGENLAEIVEKVAGHVGTNAAKEPQP